MNNITMTATLIGKAQITQTGEKASRARFTVETSGGELPLRFQILAYGHQAQTASELQDGDELLLSGRLTVNAHSKTMAVICNALEFLFESETEAAA